MYINVINVAYQRNKRYQNRPTNNEVETNN